MKKSPGKITRRNALKLGGLAMAAALGPETALAAPSPLAGKKLAMVIDLQRCTGCGSCIIACKSENNVPSGFFWSNKTAKTVGKFPNVRYEYIPTLCNHCENAPCVQVCPAGAMYKGDGDVTMHDQTKCIGCKTCVAACPYGSIYFNREKPHGFWRDDKPLIKGCTASSQEVAKKVKGKVVPYYNPDKEGGLGKSGLRIKGVVEKCTLCDHRIKEGKLPYCVEMCPAKARVFGDLNDPNSEVNRILGKYRPWRRKEHLGTKPKVFYVRDFNPSGYKATRGSI